MPRDNPWPAIDLLLKAESQVRLTGKLSQDILQVTDPYWADLIRLLQILRYKRSGDLRGIETICGEMAAKFYYPFINKVLSEVS